MAILDDGEKGGEGKRIGPFKAEKAEMGGFWGDLERA